MPELPEVETVKRGLEKLLLHEEILSVQINYPKSFEGDETLLVGLKVVGFSRRGKCLWILCSENYTLTAHLRMTGQLLVVDGKGDREGGGHPNDSLLASLPNKHTHLEIHFTNQKILYFNDQRKFGKMQLLNPEELSKDSFLSSLGPEPWDSSFHFSYVKEFFRNKKTTTKALLLDQTFVAGIGNIYADEALFLSGIHPESVPSQIPDSKIKKLIQNIRWVLERGIEFGGVSAKDYVNAEGLKGTMQHQLFVYKREGQPCKQCKEILVKSKVAGRGTHVCLSCQKKYKAKKEPKNP